MTTLPPDHARRHSTSAGTPLVARTVRARGDLDLLAVTGVDGVVLARGPRGLAGRGVALRVALSVGSGRLAAAADTVAEALSAIDREDEVGVPGSGPVAFAALPFAESTPASVVVPSLVVGQADDGTGWITTVGPPGAPALPLVAPDGDTADGPTSYRITASRSPREWCASVGAAVTAIRGGNPTKVVLAREVVVQADAALERGAILRRLAAAAPASMLYAVDGLVGCSPELLVSRRGDIVRSHPMAGTAARTGDPSVDASLAAGLLASAKDRREHQILSLIHI